MLIAIVGAAGRTGQELVAQALKDGHQVRALTRDPARIQDAPEGVDVVRADLLEPETLPAALSDVDAVLVSLGGQQRNDASTRSQGTSNLIGVMETLGLRRLLVVSTAGVGESFHQLSEGGQQAVQTVIRVAVEDHTRQEDLVRSSDLDWTIARPGGLMSGPETDYIADDTNRIQINAVNRAALARFLLDSLANEQSIGKTFGVSGS